MHSPYMKKVPGSKRALLCIHGFLGSPAHFKPFLPHIPDDISVFALLLDGHGGSTKDFGAASMEKWETQVFEGLSYLSEEYEEIYILGHSMGTLLALSAAPAFPKVRGLFLLAVPLKIRVGMTAVINSVKAVFDKHRDNATAEAYAAAHSVALSKNPFSYFSWIPRYLELFRLARKTRGSIQSVSLPCRIFQSENDELVSARSWQYFPTQPFVVASALPNSRHFIYSPEDLELLTCSLHTFLKGDTAK